MFAVGVLEPTAHVGRFEVDMLVQPLHLNFGLRSLQQMLQSVVNVSLRPLGEVGSIVSVTDSVLEVAKEPLVIARLLQLLEILSG